VFHLDRHGHPGIRAGVFHLDRQGHPGIRATLVSNLGRVLLAFDTATPFVTVALHDGDEGRIVAERRSEQRMRHGEQLAPIVESLLADAGLVRQDLTAVAVGTGPGPFTGLRVGLVTARTLGYVLDLPVYGVCTLDVIALEVALGDQPVGRDFLVATDARRKEVYLARYDVEGRRLDGVPGRDAVHPGPSGISGHAGHTEQSGQDGLAVLRPADAATDEPVAGEGPVLYPEAFPTAVGPTLPSAGWLARAVAEELAELTDPEPLYLRRPDAVAPAAPKRVS